MNNFAKGAAALGMVGAVALAMATPSEARNGRNAAAIGAGIDGLAVGAAIASSANNQYYGPSYGYYREPAYGYYDSYAYQPGPTVYYHGDPSSYYAPTYGYSNRWNARGRNYEDHLTGSGSGAIR